jgi:hypothetical protein
LSWIPQAQLARLYLDAQVDLENVGETRESVERRRVVSCLQSRNIWLPHTEARRQFRL